MRIIQNIAFFLAAVFLSKLLGSLQSFVVAKTLGPQNFGVWITLMLLVSYAPIICLGTVETMLKQVPFYRGRRESNQVREIENGVMGSIVLAASVFVVLGVVTWTAFPATVLDVDTLLVACVFIAIAANCVSSFFYHRFAAYENFKATGLMDVYRSLVAFLFVGGMAWIWGLKGAVFGYLLHELIMCGITTLYNVRCTARVGISFRRDLLVHAVRVGFPITILWWFLTLQGSIDRIVLGTMLGPLAVGHYGLGTSLMAILGMVPMVVGRVLYPAVNKQCGQENDPQSMKRLVVAPTLALGTLLVNLQVLVLIALPILYNHLLAKYQPGLMAGQILLIGSFFGCLFRNGANFLIASNKERLFLKYIVITLIFNVAINVSLAKAGCGIEGVAVGTSLAGLLLNTLVWHRVMVLLGYSYREVWHHIFVLYWPIILLASAVCCARAIYHGAFQSFGWSSLVVCGISLFFVNGLLFSLSQYRVEVFKWKQILFRKKSSLAQNVRIPDPAC